MGQRESVDREVHKVEKKISNSSVNVRASDGKLEKKIRSTSADKNPLAKSEGAPNEPNLRRSNPGSSSGSTTLSSSTSSLNFSNSSNPAPSKKESMLKISEGDIEKLQFVDFHDLQLIKILGEGSYGLVYLARWRNFNVAYKQLKNIDLEKIDEMTREAKIMFSMPSHPNVLQLFAIVLDGGNPLGMITEYLELGSLKDLLCGKQVKLTFQEIVKIAKDIAKGMQHLQDNRIVHRDLSARMLTPLVKY